MLLVGGVLVVLRSLGGVVGRRIDGAFVDADAYAVGDFDNEIEVSYFFDSTVDTAGGHNLAVWTERLAEFLDFFLTFLLRADHEEVEEKGEKFRWVKPFDITNSVRYACNYETQIPYTGINRLLAEPDEYLTFNQITKMNDKNKDDFLHIRKGAKGTPILYVNWKEVLDEEGNAKTDKDGNPIKKPFFKYFTVFSRQDILFKNGENLPSKVPTKHFSYEEIESITQRELLRFTSMINHYCNQYGIEFQQLIPLLNISPCKCVHYL